MTAQKTFIFILPVLLIFMVGCSSTVELTSTPINNKIDINGDASDWGTSLKYIPDENVAVGVTNDDNYFYLCLTTNNVGKVMPMFMSGFTVWLEDKNNDANTIGFRYPLHNIVNESRIMINPGEFREKGREMMISKMIKDQNEIRILDKDKFPVTVISTSDSSGLTAGLGFNNGQFAYELRVPIKTDDKNKYGINVSSGEKLLVQFETEKPERRNFNGRDEEGGMRPPGNMGGFPGNGRMEGMNPDGERAPFEPINFSVEVTLK